MGSCCSLSAMACNAGKVLFSEDLAAKQAAECWGTELQDLSTQGAPRSAFTKASIPPSTTSLPVMRLAGDEVTFMHVNLHSSSLLAGHGRWHLHQQLSQCLQAA